MARADHLEVRDRTRTTNPIIQLSEDIGVDTNIFESDVADAEIDNSINNINAVLNRLIVAREHKDEIHGSLCPMCPVS